MSVPKLSELENFLPAGTKQNTERWLLVNDYLHGGGAESVAESLKETLDLRGIETIVCCASERAPRSGRSISSVFGLSPLPVFRVLRKLLQNRPKVLIVHSMYHEFGWAGMAILLAISKMIGAVNVWVLHDIAWRFPDSTGVTYSGGRPLYALGAESFGHWTTAKWSSSTAISVLKKIRFLYYKMARPMGFADLLIAPSPGMLQHVRQAEPRHLAKTRVVPNPSSFTRVRRDPEAGSHLGGTESQTALPKIVLCGRLDPVKGVADFVEEIDGRFPITVIGDGAEMDRLRSIAGTLPLTLTGWVPQQRAVEIIAEHDLLAVPTVGFETFSLVLLQAAAAGVPIIIRDQAGLAPAVFEAGIGIELKAEHSQDDLKDGLLAVRREGFEEFLVDWFRSPSEYVDELDRAISEVLEV